MSADNQSGRINVSEDRLRGVMAEWELRFRDFIEKKLESKADLIMLNEARRDIVTLQVEDDKLRDRIASLEKWRYALGLLGTTALAVAAAVGHHSHLF